MSRGRGEGSFGRTADGRLFLRVSLGPGPDGKRQRTRLYGDTRAELLDAAARLRVSRASGAVATVPTRDTVGAYLDRWVAGIIRAPLTLRSYRSAINVHIAPALGRIRLAALRPEHIRQWQRNMIAAGVSPTTANKARIVLRAALADAVRDEYLARNVVTLVRPLSADGRRRKPLTADEALLLLDTVRDERLGPLYTAALGLGLRFGELLGLAWDDIDAGTVHVTRQIPTGGRVEVRMLKTGASGARSIPAPGFVLDALSRQRTMQLEDRLRAGLRWTNSVGPDLVFRAAWGGPLRPADVRADFRRQLDAAGLPPVHFHDLRHSTATLLLSLGVPMRTVQTILGHSSMRTTEVYAHVMPELSRDAMQRLDGLFRRDAR